MKNKEECSYVMDKYLELDRDDFIPLWMTRHFFMCEECRSNVRMFSQARKTLIKEGKKENPFGYATISDIKEKLYPGSTKPKKVPLIQWIVIGIVLLVCMVFCTIFANKLAPIFQFYGFIFVALIITTYVLLFIGLNMDLFVKH